LRQITRPGARNTVAIPNGESRSGLRLELAEHFGLAELTPDAIDLGLDIALPATNGAQLPDC